MFSALFLQHIPWAKIFVQLSFCHRYYENNRVSDYTFSNHPPIHGSLPNLTVTPGAHCEGVVSPCLGLKNTRMFSCIRCRLEAKLEGERKFEYLRREALNSALHDLLAKSHGLLVYHLKQN